jgi:hypothetical protein
MSDPSPPIARSPRRLARRGHLRRARRSPAFYYEIHLAPDAEPGAHRTVLVTRDEVAYQFALALEGKAARVNASWHAARQGSRSHSVLDTLEAPVA